MKLQMLCCLLISFAFVACAGLPQVDRQPEVAREHGYFVSSQEATARGGVGGYVPRASRWNSRSSAAQKTAVANPAPDTLSTTKAAPARTAAIIAAVTPPKVYFGSGSAKLSAEAKKELRAFAQESSAHGKAIQVRGYADATGSKSMNQKLTVVRAQNVAAFLRSQGSLSSSKMRVEGEGVDVAAPVGKRTPASRRVEIVTQGS